MTAQALLWLTNPQTLQQWSNYASNKRKLSALNMCSVNMCRGCVFAVGAKTKPQLLVKISYMQLADSNILFQKQKIHWGQSPLSNYFNLQVVYFLKWKLMGYRLFKDRPLQHVNNLIQRPGYDITRGDYAREKQCPNLFGQYFSP